MSAAAYRAIKRRHTRRELIRHSWALLFVFGAPVAGLVGAVAGLAWRLRESPVSIVVRLLAEL